MRGGRAGPHIPGFVADSILDLALEVAATYLVLFLDRLGVLYGIHLDRH